jgi:glycosyltransferase involved in cell wall biosynthesis
VKPGVTRVLYVNHTSKISGAERSLLDLVRALPREIRGEVACPEGDLARRLRECHIPVHRIPGTDGSLKLHWRYTPQALAEMGRAARDIRQLARTTHADVVHANSIRAGIVCCVGHRARTGPPVLVHVRDRLPTGCVSRASLALIGRRADRLVANSSYTAAGLPRFAAAKTHVVANPVDLERFRPDTITREEARRRLGIEDTLPVLALVAQITPWKGQEEAIHALGLLRKTGRDARLLIVGDAKFSSSATRYDNVAFQRSLSQIVNQLGLSDRVSFTGEREDIPIVLRAIDVLLVPSWQEPFGRTVIEGMAMGLPVIATDVGGPSEIISSGIDGLLMAPRQPALWAEGIAQLLDDPALRARIGTRARERAHAYGVASHVDAVLSIYAAVYSA